jgi:hypothetical protein
MSTVPADPTGEVALHEVVKLQVTEVAAVAPNCTVVEPGTKPEPVMVTTVPPATGPVSGETVLTPRGRVKLWLATAEAPPLFETVWPVKTWVLDVPAESVTVSEAV